MGAAARRVRVALRVAQGSAAQKAALDDWLAAAPPAPCAVLAEGAFIDLDAPAAVEVVRLAAGCMCCLGIVPLRVALTRLLRAHRPQSLLLLVATDAHLPRLRALLDSGDLGPLDLEPVRLP